MAYNLLINGVYWGYNQTTNLLLTSWDILVVGDQCLIEEDDAKASLFKPKTQN